MYDKLSLIKYIHDFKQMDVSKCGKGPKTTPPKPTPPLRATPTPPPSPSKGTKRGRNEMSPTTCGGSISLSLPTRDISYKPSIHQLNIHQYHQQPPPNKRQCNVCHERKDRIFL